MTVKGVFQRITTDPRVMPASPRQHEGYAMTTLTFAGLSAEGIQVMKDALAGKPRGEEHELSRALRTHEFVRRWWEALGAALTRGLEGSQARALLGMQIALCGADTIFLQVALDNAADAPQPQDIDRARAALTETREIEARAGEWLTVAGRPSAAPPEEQLARGMAAYERGATEDLKDVIARLRSKHSA